jgi:hypothetical protein
MTPEQFYRRISVLPFALTLLAGSLAGVFWKASASMKAPNAMVGVAKVTTLIALCGVCSAVPYLIFLGLIWRPYTGRSERAWHRLVWSAPLLIAVPFGVAIGASAGLYHFWDRFYFAGLWAIGVGYFYVVLIELAFVVSLVLGWLDRPPPAPVGMHPEPLPPVSGDGQHIRAVRAALETAVAKSPPRGRARY